MREPAEVFSAMLQANLACCRIDSWLSLLAVVNIEFIMNYELSGVGCLLEFEDVPI